jgi:3-deoxy-D-manno-octulosonic-acid transferase
MRYNTYKILTALLSGPIGLWLRIRRLRGRESRERFAERFGFSRTARPKGTLLWIHAASVGEANSVLPLIDILQARFQDINILLTTGTLTSAKLIEKRSLKNVIHQFVPVDTPQATSRFLRHWRPDIGFWVESELWPNLVMSARARACFMIIVNGRMSVKSHDSWQKYAVMMIYQMLNCFELVFAQNEGDAQRFKSLGAKDVRCLGNLKYDALPLACNEAHLFLLQQMIGLRPIWLAASTHPGEEEILAKAHSILAKSHPDLLTIIVPRHPERGPEIAKQISGHGSVALRTNGDKITADTRFYVADTLGELGLFYRLSEIVFMGGSLIEHGGQNPLEPVRLRCCIITGLHTKNFAEIYAEMEKLSICFRAQNATEIASTVDKLMDDSDLLNKSQMRGKEWLRGKTGVCARIVDVIAPIFTVNK